MRVKQELVRSNKRLQTLASDLERLESRHAKLSSSTDFDRLAKLVVDGGVVTFCDGPLQDLAVLTLKRQVLERAIAVQKEQVARCEKRVADEELKRLQGQRDALVADVYLCCGQVSERLRRLMDLRSKVEELGGSGQDFDASALFPINQNESGTSKTDSHHIAARLAIEVLSDSSDETPKLLAFSGPQHGETRGKKRRRA